MSRMRRLRWRRVAERADGVWEKGEAVGREVLEAIQKLSGGMREEVAEGSGSLGVGRTAPWRGTSEGLILRFSVLWVQKLQVTCL